MMKILACSAHRLVLLCAGAEQLQRLLCDPPDLLPSVCAALLAAPSPKVQPCARQADLSTGTLHMGALTLT